MKLYNSLTRKKEEFKPLSEENVTIYSKSSSYALSISVTRVLTPSIY